tara:strand:- start:197 stop:607 length:411 start_codon:yes stop_codon:yes gene_type:complete
MSKVVTFFNSSSNYSITRDININAANLFIPDNIFSNILFFNGAKIIMRQGNSVLGENQLLQSDVVEFIDRLDSIKKNNRINVCNRIWNGYGKYTNLTSRSCNTDCENIQCSRFENYSKYLKNKQIVGIVELRKKNT